MENLDLIIFNSILLLLVLWFVLYVNRKFVYRTRINKQRFKLFALRDELTILAMKGSVDYHSKEYQYLLKSLNSLIKITGNFQISDFLSYLVKSYSDKALQEKIRKFNKAIAAQDKELKHIWVSYYKVVNKIMSRHLRVLFMIIVSVAGIFKSIKIYSKVTSWVIEKGQTILASTKNINDLANTDNFLEGPQRF